MNTARRAKIVTIFGLVVVNGASAFVIMNRSLTVGFKDLAALAVLNGMFFGFFWFASTRMGSRDLKSIAENRSAQDPQDKR